MTWCRWSPDFLEPRNILKNPNLYIIGLTGGIACGKSTVLAMLSSLGARTIDADRVTHRVQQPGTAVYHQIVAAFGVHILTRPGGPIDRRKLGSLVFSNPDALQRLETIVHPAVRTEIKTWIASIAQERGHGTREQPLDYPIAVIDAIKLLESNWQPYCDAIWVVTCTTDQQIERLIQTRGMSAEEAQQRVAAQPPQAERIAHADVVIDNSGTIEETQAQISAAWQQILREIDSSREHKAD